MADGFEIVSYKRQAGRKTHDQPGYDSYDRHNDTSLRFSGEKGRDWVGKNDKQ